MGVSFLFSNVIYYFAQAVSSQHGTSNIYGVNDKAWDPQ